MLGSSTWTGGQHWGTISFNKIGRIAKYTNEEGKSPGWILIQGVPPGTIPLIVGEWHQDDGQSGKMVIILPQENKMQDTLSVSWGPGFLVKSDWKLSK